MEATHNELINSIPKNFPDPNHPKYWYQPVRRRNRFDVEEYWEAVGAWWFVVLNSEDDEEG